jgi:hypothetical protein
LENFAACKTRDRLLSISSEMERILFPSKGEDPIPFQIVVEELLTYFIKMSSVS